MYSRTTGTRRGPRLPAEPARRGRPAHGAASSPAAFAAEVADTPVSSLGLLFRGRGLYSRRGRADASEILQRTSEGESDAEEAAQPPTHVCSSLTSLWPGGQVAVTRGTTFTH